MQPQMWVAMPGVEDPGRGTATASLILGIVGIPFFWLFGVAPVLAIIFAFQSRAKSKNAGLG